MKKSFIDFAVGLVTGLLLLVIPYFLPWNWGGVGFDVIAGMIPAASAGTVLLLSLVLYLLVGLIVFGLYALTPFYKRKHEGGPGIIPSFVSFSLGIVLSFLVLVILAGSALSRMNPSLPL